LNRKLLTLNVVLVALAIYAGFQLHGQWVAAKAREAAARSYRARPVPAAALAPLPQEPAVLPSGYKDVAMNDLFDQSRNPNVPVEPPPPPPPPKPVPPLPAFHGMMDIGDGPIAMMSRAGSSEQQEVRAGGMIGEFKLLDFNRQEIALEWEGKVIHKRVDEVADKSATNQQGPSEIAPGTVLPGIVNTQAPQEGPKRDLGPGPDNGGGNRPCQANDSSPAGTTTDGYRKVVIPTLFGNTCYWAPVGK